MDAVPPAAPGEQAEKVNQHPSRQAQGRSSTSTRKTAFVRIVPRPRTPPLRTESSVRQCSLRRTCKVPQCPNRPCSLASHRHYDPNQGNRGLKRDITAVKTTRAKVVESEVSVIGRKGVDGLPSMPLPESQDPHLRTLFHHFFDSVFDRLANLFRGPGQIPDYKNRMLGVALTNETYCMGLITQAQTDMCLAQGQAETRYSLELYTKLIRIFRRQLAANNRQSPPQPAYIEIALLIICILLSYSVMYRGTEELTMNWNAMRYLVGLRGGIHHLTTALPYVAHVDRLCATLLGVYPTYINPPGQRYQFCRPSGVEHGSGFRALEQSQTRLICDSVLDYAADTCELLSLHEAIYGGLSRSDQADLPQPSSPDYLYYRRDRVDEQFAILHAKMVGQSTMSKCVLLATRIVEYPATWANYTPTLTKHLCTELSAILQGQNLLQVWSDQLHVLRWILATLATSAGPFQGRDWVITFLLDLLEAKYGVESCPEQWRAGELLNLKSFVWPEERLAERLSQVWRELEQEFASDTKPDERARMMEIFQRPRTAPLVRSA